MITNSARRPEAALIADSPRRIGLGVAVRIAALLLCLVFWAFVIKLVV